MTFFKFGVSCLKWHSSFTFSRRFMFDVNVSRTEFNVSCDKCSMSCKMLNVSYLKNIVIYRHNVWSFKFRVLNTSKNYYLPLFHVRPLFCIHDIAWFMFWVKCCMLCRFMLDVCCCYCTSYCSFFSFFLSCINVKLPLKILFFLHFHVSFWCFIQSVSCFRLNVNFHDLNAPKFFLFFLFTIKSRKLIALGP